MIFLLFLFLQIVVDRLLYIIRNNAHYIMYLIYWTLSYVVFLANQECENESSCIVYACHIYLFKLIFFAI